MYHTAFIISSLITLFNSIIIVNSNIIINNNELKKNLNNNSNGNGHTTIPLISIPRRKVRDFGTNPYLPLTGKDMNFLLLRNGMSRMPPTSFHSTMNSPSTSTRSTSHQQYFSNRPEQHVHYQQKQQSDLSSSTISKQIQPPQPNAVFQPPPPNFKPNVAIENNLEFDLQSDSSRDNNEQWPPSNVDQPKITFLDVKCDRNAMKVTIHFSKPFYGVIFSKGHYTYRNCIYLMPNSGVKKLYFDISISACGTSGNAQGTFFSEDVSLDNGLYFENTIIIQYDPQVQEAWDQARRLRCTWHDQYEKAVMFRPFPVDMLDVVRADFAGDNVGCWMQIQVGKGPWASEVAGIVKIGQTMTMVLAIKDEESKFDMLVRNCIAHDGKRSPIELVDGNGCILRPKLMTKFTKIKNFGSSASVLAYTHFQAFKFPDSMEVHFQCTIQICRFQCPEQCTKQSNAEIINLYNDESEKKRKRRDLHEMVISGTMKPMNHNRNDNDEDDDKEKEIGLNKAIQVVSPRDLSFPLNLPLVDTNNSTNNNDISIIEESSNMICISTITFISALTSVAVVCFACTTIFLILIKRNTKSKQFSNNFHSFFLSTYF